MAEELLDYVAGLKLVDHHCHGVMDNELDRDTFESLLTEADWAGPLGGTLFDSQIGFAVRRWCAPVLDLAPHASAEDYLARRAGLGTGEVNRRFLEAADLGALCVDAGFAPESLESPEKMGVLAGAPAFEIVRLERLAEELTTEGVTAAGFADAFRMRLNRRARDAVAVKSIAAYRVGLDLAAARPSEREVSVAAGRWLERGNGTEPPRLAEETLHRFLIWCGVDLGLPIQFHVGYGDRDVDLHRCDPLLLTGLLRAIEPTGTPVMLLHNYPFHRQAGYLAQVFGNVFVDAGLATHNLGDRAPALIAETLELTPFGKFLFSSDAFGLSELYHLGALQFRRGLSDFLRSGLERDSWSEKDAIRVAHLVGGENARRVYRLEAP
jgi:uncharacterized protein